MIARRLGIATAASLLMGSAAMAEPLTCAAFKDRLGGALIVSGDSGIEAPDFKDSRKTDTGGSHINWSTSALSGSLTCGPGDRFQEFYVSLDVTSRDRFVEQLKRLVSLDGAAICSLGSAAPGACVETGKFLLQDALSQMGAGFKKRLNNPSGNSNRMLWPDIKAEQTAAPSLITFSLAVPDGAVADATRRPLPALPKQDAPAASQ